MSAVGGEHDRAPLIEVRLHRLSPFPLLINAALVALVLVSAFLALAAHYGQPVFVSRADGGLEVESAAWAAFVMALVFSGAVTLPAWTSRQWRTELEALSQTLDTDGAAQAAAMVIGPPMARAGSALLWFGVGVVGGLAFNLWIMTVSGVPPLGYVDSVGVWFLAVSPLLFGLGSRAAKQLHDEDRDMARLVQAHMIVDLARLDRNWVYGRLALRGAGAWLVMAALILLFFVYAAPVSVSIGALVLSLLAGAYAFSSTIAPVVRTVSAAREAALAEVRTQILTAGRHAVAGESADGVVGELTAFETWLEKRPAWPISAPVTRRFALYGLIPVLAWFGAAAAELLLARFA